MKTFENMLKKAVVTLALACGCVGLAQAADLEIGTLAELVAFRDAVNASSEYTDSVKLTADIDMSSVANWTPISNSQQFTGTFDGNGHKLINLTISSDTGKTGFFSYTGYEATIKNLTLVNPTVTQSKTGDVENPHDYTGALVGHGYCVNIEDCTIQGGVISGDDQVGAIIGYLGCGHVTGCTVDGTKISGSLRVGGIAGKPNVDSGYSILNNVVRHAVITSNTKHGVCGVGAIVGQIITASDKEEWEIKGNCVIACTTTVGTDDTFVPIGHLRGSNYKEFIANHISGNSWYPTTSPNTFTMSDGSNSITLDNAITAETAPVVTVDTEDSSDKTAYVITDTSTYSVDSAATKSVITDTAVATKVETTTTVSGVELTKTEKTATVSGSTEKVTGIQAVVDAAKAKAGETSEFTTIAKAASDVNIKVDVVVTPTAYVAPVAEAEGVEKVDGQLAFKLEPKATVTVYKTTTTEGVTTTEAKTQVVEVTNDMIDQNHPISVNLYTGFQPKTILHNADDGSLIESFTGSDITYNATTGIATVQITHFSTLTASSEDYVAQIGSTSYKTLVDAFDAVPQGGETATTITLIANVNLSGDSYSIANKNIVLDGQNYTITASQKADHSALLFDFYNGTKFDMKDVKFEVSGYAYVIAYDDTSACSSGTMKNVSVTSDGISVAVCGETTVLTLDNCVVKHTADAKYWYVDADHTYDSYYTALAAMGKGTVNVKGGTTIVSDKYGAYVFTSAGTINIDGASVTAPSALKCDSYQKDAWSTINVASGTIDGKMNLENNWSAGSGGSHSIINLNGGTYTNFSWSSEPKQYGWTENVKLVISAGIYDVDPTEYVVSSSTVKASTPSEGYWTVVPAVAQITVGETTTYYQTLAAAIAAVQSGETITLLADNAEKITMTTTVPFSINANSKALSGSVTPAAGYKFTINSDGTCSYAARPDDWVEYAAETYATAVDTENKVVTIASAAELGLFAKQVNAGTSYAGYTINIGAVDLSAHEWVPVFAQANLAGATITGGTITGLNTTKHSYDTTPANYSYYGGFISQVKGDITFKDLSFANATVNVANGSGAAVLLGTSWSGNVTFDNVTISGSTVTATTKAGLLMGFTSDATQTVNVKGCTITTSTVKANYSSALLVGLIQDKDTFTYTSANISIDDGSKFTWVADANEFAEKGTQYGDAYYAASGDKLWLTDPGEKCWAEKRTGETKTIDGTTYTVMGSVFYPTYVAQVVSADGKTTTKYETLLAAIKAAASGETIYMLADVSDETGWKAYYEGLSAGVTLDGQNHTLSGAHSLGVDNGGITIQNVRFVGIHNDTVNGKSSYYRWSAKTGSKSAIYAETLGGDKTLTIKNCYFDQIDWDGMQLTNLPDGSVITIEGNEFHNSKIAETSYAGADATGIALRYVHLEVNLGDITVNFKGNNFYDAAIANAVGLYKLGKVSVVTASNNYVHFVDGEKTTRTDIALSYEDGTSADVGAIFKPLRKTADATVADYYPEVVLKDESDTYYYFGNGWRFTDTLETLLTDENETFTVKLAKDVTLDASTVKSAVVIDLNGKTLTTDFSKLPEGSKVEITGSGKTTTDPTAYVDTNAISVTTNADGTWTLTPIPAAKNVKTGTTYLTLQEAVFYAAADEEVQLLRDIDLDDDNVSIDENKTATIDLAGYTLYGSESSVIYTEGTLTLNDSSEGQTGAIRATLTTAESHPVYVAGGTVTINGGNYVGSIPVFVVNGRAVINDGIFTVGDNVPVSAVYVYYSTASVEVNGGYFDNRTRNNYYYHIPCNGTATIKGGYYATRYVSNKSLATGYMQTSNTDTSTSETYPYMVIATPVKASFVYNNKAYGISCLSPASAIAELQYYTKEGGTYAGATNLTVTLLTDYTGDFTLPVGIKFDTNGKAYTGTVSAPEGYRAVRDENGVYTVEAIPYVAQIGDTKYKSLSAAVEAVEDNQIITLLEDVNLADDKSLTDGKLIIDNGLTFTIDLGGKTLTGRTNITHGNVTYKNGTVAFANGQPLNVYGNDDSSATNYSVVTVGSDVTVEGYYGVCVFGPTASSTAGYGACATINGEVKAVNGVFVSGNLGNGKNGADTATTEELQSMLDSNVVSINGTFDCSGVAVAMNGQATVEIERDAKITGTTGIGLKRGYLVVDDGATITANGGYVNPVEADNNGTENTGAALSLTSTYNYAGTINAVIGNATLTSQNGVAVYVGHSVKNAKPIPFTKGATVSIPSGTYKSADSINSVYVAPSIDGDSATYPTKFISGGVFSTDPASYLVSGFTATHDTVEPSWWRVGLSVKVSDGSEGLAVDLTGEQLAKAGVSEELIQKLNVEATHDQAVKDINAQINAKTDTKNANWQKAVLGIAADGEVNAVMEQNTSPELATVSLDVHPETVSGVSVSYSLYRENEETPVDDNNKDLEKPVFTKVPLPSGSENLIKYTVKATFTKTGSGTAGDLGETESLNTVAILKNTSATSTTVIGVPWTKNGTTKVTVADLVKISTLSEGDTLKVYNPKKDGTGGYETYTLDASHSWVNTATTGGTAADELEVARGQAAVLTRSSTLNPIYFEGEYTTEPVTITVEAPAEEDNSAKVNIVASPSVEGVDLTTDISAEKVTPISVGKIGDAILVPAASGYTRFQYYGGQWLKIWTDTSTGRNLTTPATTEEMQIPAGSGFYYLSNGGTPSITK